MGDVCATNVADKGTVMSAVNVSEIAKRMVHESLVQDGQNILSIASGIGLDEAYLVNNLDISLIGTDLDDDFLASSRQWENKRLKFLKMDVTKEFTVKGTFSCVYARNLLHYFKKQEQEEICVRVWDIIDSGGLFIFQLKSRDDFFYTDPSVEKIEIDDGMIYFPELGFSRNHLSEKEVCQLMKRSGFEVDEISSHQEKLYNDPHESTIITVVARKA